MTTVIVTYNVKKQMKAGPKYLVNAGGYFLWTDAGFEGTTFDTEEDARSAIADASESLNVEGAVIVKHTRKHIHDIEEIAL